MSKYKKIQREKLSGKSLEIYDKLKKASNNFENTEGKIGEALDKFYNKVEKTAVEVEKKVDPKKSTPKKSTAKKSTPKKTTKKKTTKKKTPSKKPSYKNVNQGRYAKLASKIMKEKGISYREAQKEASKIFAEEKKAKREAKAKAFSKGVTAFKKKYKGKGTGNTDIEKDASISAKPVGKRVSKRGKVYYEYRDNRTDQKQPQPSDYPRLAKGGTIMSADIKEKIFDENGERKIDKKSIEILTDYVNSLEQTKSANQKDGEYTPSRKKLHGKIIEKFKDGVVCIDNNKPIAILMGGSPASGKSTFLKKYAPYLLKDEILRIDADEVRAMLPEYEGWNASQTHLETKDIVNTLLSDRTIGLPCETDIIYDGTMNSNKSYLPLIKLLRKMDYKIFVVYIDKVPKDVIVDRALNRYKSSGRFVPLEVIDDFFDKGKTALNEIKKKVDGYMIVDGSSGDYKVIEEGGMKLPKTRKYGKIGSPMKKKMEFGGDIAKSYDVRPPYGTYAKGGEVDDLGNPTDPKVIAEMEKFIKEEKPKLDKDRFFTDAMRRKEAKRKFYEKYEYGAYNPRFSFFAEGGKVEFRKLAKSKNFDIITPDGRYEIEMGAFGMPKSIIVDGQRRDINSSPIAKKYRNEIQSYLDDNYAKGGKITELKSVGSMLDVDKAIIYPQLSSGKADMASPMSLTEDEVSSEWYDSLSKKDELMVNKSISLSKKRMAKGGKMKRDWSTYYNDGGMVEGYDVRSPYGTYAKGGEVFFHDTKSNKLQEWERRKSKSGKKSFGAFAHRMNNKYIGDYYLYELDDFDKKMYSNIKLKDGEMLVRVETDNMVGGESPLVKINLKNGRVYFMSDSSDEKNPKFDRASADVIFISVDKSMDKFAEGGTLPIGYHRMPDGEIMADSEHFAKGGYVCMNCGEYAKGGKIGYRE